MQTQTKKFEVTVCPKGSVPFKEYVEVPGYAGPFEVSNMIKAKYGKDVNFYGIREIK